MKKLLAHYRKEVHELDEQRLKEELKSNYKDYV